MGNHICECTARGGQRRASCPLDLESQAVVRHQTWLPGTDLSSLREQEALLPDELSPHPTICSVSEAQNFNHRGTLL